MNIHIPTAAETTLRRAFGDQLDRAALEALAIEGYRSARISLGEVAQLLGFSTSLEAGQWLATRGVSLNYAADDLAADRSTLDRLLGAVH